MSAAGFRRLVLVTHRWLGLTTSLILAVVGATGAIIVWNDNRLGRFAGRLHETLGLGQIGVWIVIVVSAIAIVLEIGGLFLWWKRRSLAVRMGSGWRRFTIDVHHTAGAIAFPIMLVLAVSGVLLSVVSPESADARRIIMALHTSRPLPLPIRVLYTIATLVFVVQGVSGIVMWWKPPRQDVARR